MKKFTYISEDDGRLHEARSLDWDTILDEDMPAHVEDEEALVQAWNAVPSYVEANARAFAAIDDKSVSAIASMQACIGSLIAWRDDTCVGGLAPRIVESCACPVCVAIRSQEIAIAHIYRIFE